MQSPRPRIALAAAATLIAAGLAGPALAAAGVIAIDGVLDKAYGPPIVIQNNQTGFGNSDLGLIDAANGSELDVLHATVIGDTLHLFIAGNLESNFNKLDIFIDCREGGQNTLRNDNANVNFNGLNRMGTSPIDPSALPGLTFDEGFAADYFIVVNGGGEPYSLFMDYATLPTLGGGEGEFGGGGGAGVETLANNGIRFSINNANVGGVDGGDGFLKDGGAGVVTGLEFAIPLDAIGFDGSGIKVCAFVNGSGHDFLSNQVLGGLGGLPNLGEPRLVNFAFIAGEQYGTVVDGDTGSYCGDPGAGDCCSGGKTAYCSDGLCCNAVCALDPTCCEVAWDAGCADLAAQVCVACGGVETCGGSADDCNFNGLADGCDIAFGLSADCNLDGIPDECQSETFFCIDGRYSEEYGEAIAVQDTQTNFGNSDTGLVDFANGSEIDGVYAFRDDDHLHLLFSGNLEANYNKLEVFIDCAPGGQNRLVSNNADVDFNALGRMGPDPANPKAGPGLAFDAGFDADFYVNMGGGGGGGGAYDLYLNWATLPTDGGGIGSFAGPGRAGLPNFAENGLAFSIDNTNIFGVDGGIELVPDGGAGVLTGMEIRVPLALMGYNGGPLRVCAFVNASGHDFVSNQVLGPIGGGDNLGDPRFLDFASIAGDQYVVVLADENLCPADFNGDGVVNGADLAAILGAWGTSNPTFDITGDGVVGGADLSAVLAAWGDCP